MVNLSAHLQGRATATATLSTLAHFALHHLFAACRFAARIEEVERENSGQPFGAFWEESA